MIQKTESLSAVSPDEATLNGHAPAVLDEQPEHLATIWVSRLTGIGGGLCLLVALSYWFARPGHYRPVLILLTIAMFAAILHSYVFENGDHR